MHFKYLGFCVDGSEEGESLRFTNNVSFHLLRGLWRVLADVILWLVAESGIGRPIPCDWGFHVCY